MNASRKAYKRLPGKKANTISFHTLWAGEDHLLHIHSQRVRENYKRYYYKDIQAVYIRKNAKMLIENCILGFFLTCSLLLAWFDVVPIFHYIMSVPLGLAFLYNLFRGPTCHCHIQTLVQKEQLPSLYRIRTARKAMDILQPLIIESQGELTEAMLKTAGESEGSSEPVPAPSEPLASPGDRPNSRMHGILFFLLLASGIVTGIDILVEQVAVTLTSTIISSGAVICAIVALVRQYEVKTGKGVQTLTWMSLAFLCLEMLMGYGMYMYVLFTHMSNAYNQWEAFRHFSALSPMEKPVLLAVFLFSAVGGILFGMMGLIFILKNRRRRDAALPRPGGYPEPVAVPAES